MQFNTAKKTPRMKHGTDLDGGPLLRPLVESLEGVVKDSKSVASTLADQELETPEDLLQLYAETQDIVLCLCVLGVKAKSAMQIKAWVESMRPPPVVSTRPPPAATNQGEVVVTAKKSLSSAARDVLVNNTDGLNDISRDILQGIDGFLSIAEGVPMIGPAASILKAVLGTVQAARSKSTVK